MSLRLKVVLGAAVYLTVLLVVMAAGGYLVQKESAGVKEVAAQAKGRAGAASMAQAQILEMDRAMMSLIAAHDAADIRRSAISSIRAGSATDEALAALQASMPESADVATLIALMGELRPKQMQVIGAARRNQDADAMRLANEIRPAFDEILQIAGQIVLHADDELLADIDRAHEATSATMVIVAVLCLVGIGLGLLCAFVASSRIAAPMVKVQGVMEAVAAGDLSQNLEVKRVTKDEIGHTVKAIQRTLVQLRGVIDQVRAAATGVAAGAESISSGASVADEGAKHIEEGVSLIQAQTALLTDASNRCNDRVEHVSGCADEAREIAASCGEQILAAREDFERFRGQVQQVSTQSAELAEIAGKIQSFIKTISGISEQTALLALNATIEAARAGEHGRGFAVVASEVRSLAGDTSQATQEIGQLVLSVQSSTTEALASIEEVVKQADQKIERLQLIAEKSNESSEQIAEISDAMGEIREMMDAQRASGAQFADAAHQLAEVSSRNYQHAEDLNDHSHSLRDASSGLKQALAGFSY